MEDPRAEEHACSSPPPEPIDGQVAASTLPSLVLPRSPTFSPPQQRFCGHHSPPSGEGPEAAAEGTARMDKKRAAGSAAGPKPILKRRRLDEQSAKKECEGETEQACGLPRLSFMNDAQALAFLTSPEVLEEWPFMADLHFLVTVITDMRHPDYPVIYASDSFEGMTLYPKKDILGSNLRILQGKCTNKETVSKLRAAIMNGEQIEAHILNYRKDGTPFWNKFMALPIKDKEGRLTHYVGIQQDVTLLTEMGSDPKRWTSAEVGMWLDHVDLGDYSLQAIQQEIVGADLFSKDGDNIADKLGMTNEHDRKYLTKRIKRLRRNPQLSFSSSFSSFDFSSSALSLQALSQSGPKKVRFDPKTFFPQDAQEKITVRCTYRDRLYLFSIHRDTTFSRLRNKILSLFPRLTCVVEQIHDYSSGSGTSLQRSLNSNVAGLNIFPIRSDEELNQAIMRVLTSRSQIGHPVMRLRLAAPADDDPAHNIPRHASVPLLPIVSPQPLSPQLEPALSLTATSSFFASTSHSLPGFAFSPEK